MCSFLESEILLKKWSNLRSTLTQNMALFSSADTGRTDISLKTPYFLAQNFLDLLFEKVFIFTLFEALLASPLETNFYHESPFVSANLVSRIGSGLCTLLPWRPQPVNLINIRYCRESRWNTEPVIRCTDDWSQTDDWSDGSVMNRPRWLIWDGWLLPRD